MAIAGLKEFHKKNRYHGDVKLASMLVTTDGAITFIDEICDSFRQKRMHSIIATMSPDNPAVFFKKIEDNNNDDQYFTKPDIYSLGVELLAICSRYFMSKLYRDIVQYECKLLKIFDTELAQNEYSISKTQHSPKLLNFVLSQNIKLRNFIVTYKKTRTLKLNMSPHCLIIVST